MLNIRVHTGIALASLIFHAMFVAYMLSLYYALSRPPVIEVGELVPWWHLFIGVSVFGIPGFGFAGVAYLLAKRQESKAASTILVSQGILMLVGMFYASILETNIIEGYKSFALLIATQAFFVAGFAPIYLGVRLARLGSIRRMM